MYSGGPRATRALLTSGDSSVAHAGDLVVLGCDDGEPDQSIFLCPFVNLPCSTVLGMEKRVVHVWAHKQRRLKCHMFRVPECSLEIVGTDLLLNGLTLCPINSGKFGR